MKTAGFGLGEEGWSSSRWVVWEGFSQEVTFKLSLSTKKVKLWGDHRCKRRTAGGKGPWGGNRLCG